MGGKLYEIIHGEALVFSGVIGGGGECRGGFVAEIGRDSGVVGTFGSKGGVVWGASGGLCVGDLGGTGELEKSPHSIK